MATEVTRRFEIVLPGRVESEEHKNAVREICDVLLKTVNGFLGQSDKANCRLRVVIDLSVLKGKVNE